MPKRPIDAAANHRAMVQDLIDDAVEEIERDRNQTAIVVETAVLRGYLRGLLGHEDLGDDVKTPVVPEPLPTSATAVTSVGRHPRRPRGVFRKE